MIGVLAVTSAILILNNRLNELQLSLSKDSALIASTVSRAKSLALQNSAGIGGYGARFESEDVDKDSFYIFKDKDIDGYSVGEDKLEKMNLSSGVIFYNPTGAWPFITDVVFFSSDANVKLFDSKTENLKILITPLLRVPAIVILQTDTTPSSFYTLKITITGQVSSKSGLYISPADFDAGKKSVMNDDGTIGDAPRRH